MMISRIFVVVSLHRLFTLPTSGDGLCTNGRRTSRMVGWETSTWNWIYTIRETRGPCPYDGHRDTRRRILRVVTCHTEQ